MHTRLFDSCMGGLRLKGTRINFTDGVSLKTSGALRVVRRFDGYYVAGQGMLVPVNSYEEARSIIDRLNCSEGENACRR